MQRKIESRADKMIKIKMEAQESGQTYRSQIVDLFLIGPN